MRIILYIVMGLSACGLLTAVGCDGGERFTLQGGMEKMMGVDSSTTPVQTAARAFDETDPDVRRQAIETLSHQDWALRDPYLKRFAALTNPELEPDPAVRAVCVRALGKAGDTKYHPEILLALNDASSMVRWDATIVLDRMPTDKAVVDLRRLVIQDESVDVRAGAARALQHYRTDEVYRTLLRALDDDDFTVRSAAHDALVRQTGRDCGYESNNWVHDSSQVGQETMPTPVQVRYNKKPWWDWAGVTKESETVQPAERPEAPDGKSERPWWDWAGVTE